MQEIKAPNEYNLTDKVSLFTAGSIEMGVAENWQEKLKKELSCIDSLLILNPRRDNWQADWLQDKSFPQFREQVTWELEAQEKSDINVMYFDPKTKSPITLLELGLFADHRLIVFCPQDFWRKGNVDLVCERYEIEQAISWDDFVDRIKKRIMVCENENLSKIW